MRTPPGTRAWRGTRTARRPAWDRPAFGRATSGTSPAAGRMSRITRSSCAGPSPQFAPIASAPNSTRRSATCDGDEPSSVRSSFVNVALTTTASDGAPARAAASACSISRRSVCVSTTNRSTPPSASAAAWSRYASNASSGLTRPYGASRTPSGPIEPATNRAPASRARAAAARLSSAVRAARPCVPSRNRFPPNVFVRTMSEPAWTNARWIWSDPLRVVDVQQLEARADRLALLDQRRAHAAVGQERPFGEERSERGAVHHPSVGVRHARPTFERVSGLC